jgi:ankyrin repeat protein
MFVMGGYGSGARFLMWIATRNKDTELAQWLLAHGARPDPLPARDPRFSKESVYADAIRAGAPAIAELLRQYGAPATMPKLEDEEAFVDACLRLDRDAAQSHLQRHPEYLLSPKAMFAAAERNRPDVIELLLDLGVSVDVGNQHNERPLHHAAAHNAIAVATLLIERGADIDPKDAQWNATPIGWAAHGDQQAMIDFLSHYSRNVWTLAFRGYVERLRVVLREDPSLARVVDREGNTPLWWLPDDEDKALEVVALLLACGVDPAVRNSNGNTAAGWARKRGMLRVAQKLEL